MEEHTAESLGRESTTPQAGAGLAGKGTLYTQPLIFGKSYCELAII